LSNAIKFSSENTKVYFHLNEIHDGYEFIIHDQGLGFSEEDLKIAFTPFQKLSSKPTAGESSSGLGLSIVKKLTNKLNATLSLESKKGEGSKFILHFKHEIVTPPSQ
jgi:signal transduction histidine kinase